MYNNTTTLKMTYIAYFHAVIENDVIFWGNLVEGKRVFQQQKKNN